MAYICAIFKDEGAYLEEWLAWHRLAGFTHFFLYDNDSTDGWTNTHDDVNVMPWPGVCMQLPAYEHLCVQLKKTEPDEWVAFIDCDEFLYHPDHVNIVEMLPSTSSRVQHQLVNKVIVPWRVFGWKPHVTIPPGGVVENYCWRAKDDVEFHSSEVGGKVIVRIGYAYGWLTPHHVTSDGLTWIDSGILCNHYWTKSKEEAQKKFARPRADNGRVRTSKEVEKLMSQMNDVQDDRLASLWRTYARH